MPGPERITSKSFGLGVNEFMSAVCKDVAKLAGFACKVPAAKRTSVAQRREETAVKKIDAMNLERDDKALLVSDS